MPLIRLDRRQLGPQRLGELLGQRDDVVLLGDLALEGLPIGNVEVERTDGLESVRSSDLACCAGPAVCGSTKSITVVVPPQAAAMVLRLPSIALGDS